MADPNAYLPDYSFSNWQAANPTKPLPGPRVDDELANASTSTQELVAAIKDIRRSDGALKNGIVTYDSLDPAVALILGSNADLQTIVEHIDEITTVASISVQVVTVAGIQAQVTTVAGIAPNVTTVAGVAASIPTVAGIAASVTTVANNVGAVVNVSANMADVLAVAADQVEIDIVAANIGSVNTNAANIVAIQNAAANAALAAGYATNPEDVPIPGTGGLYSAFHWYRKTKAVADGILNTLAGWIHAATAKPVIADADEFGFWDSVSLGLRKLTFANLITALMPRVGADFVEDLIPTWVSTSTMSVSLGSIKMNSRYAVCSSVFTKSLNSAFAAGTGVGGLDTGAKANSTTYHIHGLLKNSDASFDWCYSLSVSAPTVPAGYSLLGRIGCCKTDGSGNIIQQFQTGNNLRLATLILEMNVTTAIGNGAVAMSALPDGVSVDALLTLVCSANAGGCQILVGGFYSAAPSGYHEIAANSGNSVSSVVTDQVDGYARSSTAKQIYRAVNATAAAITAQIYTAGWNDYTVPRKRG